MANPTVITWTDPTSNTDGSPIVAGEITGYKVGVRASTGTVGIYPSTATVAASATSCPLSALTPSFGTSGSFMAVVQTESTTNGNSAWSAEVAFAMIPPVPNPPSALSVA